MNTEGKTPSVTPKTRTVSAHFYIGYDYTGDISYGQESWPVVHGVVHCPLEIGENNGWTSPTYEQFKAFGVDPDADAKAADAKAEAEAKAEADAKAAAEKAEADAKAAKK